MVGLIAEPLGDTVVNLVELGPRERLDLFVHVFKSLCPAATAAGAKLGLAVGDGGRRDFQTFKFVLK